MSGVKMPFGKHNGMPLELVPPDYLLWVLDNCDLRPALKRAIEQVVYGGTYDAGYRDGFAAGLRSGQQQGPATTNTGERITERISQWYRRASLQHHPDRGGDLRVMSALNQLRDEVLTAIQKEQNTWRR